MTYMIDWFGTSELGSDYSWTLFGEMICRWSNSNTTLMLHKIVWPGKIRASYHLVVEDAHSKAVPVSIGINSGLTEIDDAVANKIDSRELFRLIVRMNPEIEGLIGRHSPETEKLIIKRSIAENFLQAGAAKPAFPEASKSRGGFWSRIFTKK